MEPMPKLDRSTFIIQLRQRVEATLGEVADAVNNAPDGDIIGGSEIQVRDLFAKLRQETFELAAQMRVDAAESKFTSPVDTQSKKNSVTRVDKNTPS